MQPIKIPFRRSKQAGFAVKEYTDFTFQRKMETLQQNIQAITNYFR